MPVEPSKYLTIKKLSESKTLPWEPSPEAIRMMVARQNIPFRRVNGKIVFILSEIEEWIQDSPGVKPDDLKES